MMQEWNCPPLATPEEAEAFFRAFDCHVEKSVSAVFAALGKPGDSDDWDFGRFVVEWRNQTLCVRMYARSDTVNSVVIMPRGNTPRFGVPLEVLWENPVPNDL